MIDSHTVNTTKGVAVQWLREGRRFVQALLIEVEGSAPLPVGTMMLVDEFGNIEGSVTGGCVEGASSRRPRRSSAPPRARSCSGMGSPMSWPELWD